jgi:hypothetical protein
MVRLSAYCMVALSVFVFVATVRARDTAECAAAYEEAQVLRQQSKLQDAHAHLVMCTDASCPAAVVRDCVTWLTDVENAMPTVVLAAQDDDGVDLIDVKITVDGVALSPDMVGKAINLDPGAHSVRAELEGYDTNEQGLVAREGEKSRVVTFVLHRIASGDDAAAQEATGSEAGGTSLDESTTDADHKPGLGWKVYTLGTVAVVAGIGGVVLGVSGKKDVDTLHAPGNCGTTNPPSCAESEVNTARMKLIGANVAFGVAGAAAIGTAVFWWMGKRKAAKPTAGWTRPRASVGMLPGGGMAVLTGSY